MPETADYLLAQANLCRQFASEVRSAKMASDLRGLAEKYDERAKLLTEDEPAF